MANENLLYSPLWYRFDDDEYFAVGFLNGVLAIVVLWLIERFAENILFSKGTDLSLSEVAAFVTLRGCSWRNLITWWKKPDFPENRERNGPTVTFFGRNRMAIWGFLFRFLVTTLEVLVLILTLWKRSYHVHEADVGTSQITFGNGTELIHDANSYDFSPCLTDRLEYTGFSSSAIREVCWERLLRNSPMPASKLQGLSETNRVEFSLRYVPKRESLAIRSGKEEYRIYHAIKFLEKDNRFLCRDRLLSSLGFSKLCRLKGNKSKDDGDIPTLMIPMEKNVTSAAANAILKRNDKRVTDCKITRKQGQFVFISCSVKRKQKGFAILLTVLESIRTKKATAKKILKTYNGDEIENIFIIGTYKRPLLTAPILAIVIVLIFSMDLIYRCARGSQDIVINLFNVAQRAAGFKHIVNAMHVQERKINLSENIDDQEQGKTSALDTGFSSNETKIPTDA